MQTGFFLGPRLDHLAPRSFPFFHLQNLLEFFLLKVQIPSIYIKTVYLPHPDPLPVPRRPGPGVPERRIRRAWLCSTTTAPPPRSSTTPRPPTSVPPSPAKTAQLPGLTGAAGERGKLAEANFDE